MFETKAECFRPEFSYGDTHGLGQEPTTIGKALQRHLQTQSPQDTVVAQLAKRLKACVEDFDSKWEKDSAKNKVAEEDLISHLREV